MTAARKPQSQGSRELMHEMSIWATQHRPKLILTEYMRRLVLAQPKNGWACEAGAVNQAFSTACDCCGR